MKKILRCRRTYPALIGLVALASGCGVTPPRAEKFFDRASPVETLRGFVYAVDAHQWDYAFESLSEESRDEIGPLRFEWAVRFAEVKLLDPVRGEEQALELSLYELISSALDRVSRHSPSYRSEGGDAKSMPVSLKARDDCGIPTVLRVRIFFVLEEAGWRLDLLRSLRFAMS